MLRFGSLILAVTMKCFDSIENSGTIGYVVSLTQVGTVAVIDSLT